LEGNGLFQVLSQHTPEGTQESAPLEYKSRASLLHQSSGFVSLYVSAAVEKR
jgi:hypothetical protein